ncbi:hypothetical protein [Clostridium septicum]|uniref:Uncharacterized protein n=1 Tax=Clostridium septicum TaxID=1504 RepID=A0A9N7JNC5_CLOSE|nr:hypothetical protein [Clostridium septicum]AYE35673.1 hypothetical protein CP523_15225 [Clostridium septicum]UEC19656.1 hypothetical protein LK444_09490 [Clostridium septicum]USS02283.1 hypothetical protein NH397_07685 [Clostridium septicum]
MNYEIFKTIVPPVIAGLITYRVANKNIFSNIRLQVANEQLKKVYLPLFIFLEPYLYKQPDIQIIKSFINMFNEIKSTNYELIDSDLLNCVQILEKSIHDNKYNFNYYESVCSILDKLFERTRKLLKLPTRSISYRLNNKQYGTSINEAIKFIEDIVLKVLPILLLTIIFIIIHTFINTFIHLLK